MMVYRLIGFIAQCKFIVTPIYLPYVVYAFTEILELNWKLLFNLYLFWALNDAVDTINEDFSTRSMYLRPG